jgi:hypothetical protein
MKHTQSKKWYLTQDGQVYRITFYYSKGGINYFNYKTDPRGYSLSVVPIEVQKGYDGSYSVEVHGMFSGFRHFVAPAERFSLKRFNDLLNEHNGFEELIQTLVNSCIDKGWCKDYNPQPIAV